MKLNCDLAEFDQDIESSADILIMPHIDMANIACGFHASNAKVMSGVVALAVQHGVLIGAHPGYFDKKNFGRRAHSLSTDEIASLVAYQIGALQGICCLQGTSVEYVKPHGALYHAMMSDEDIFIAILKAIKSQNFKAALMIFSGQRNERYQNIANIYNVSLLFEAFADRAYTAEGALVPREKTGAVITDSAVIRKQIEGFKTGSVITESGKEIRLPIDSICVHGDTPNAPLLIQQIRGWL